LISHQFEEATERQIIENQLVLFSKHRLKFRTASIVHYCIASLFQGKIKVAIKKGLSWI